MARSLIAYPFATGELNPGAATMADFDPTIESMLDMQTTWMLRVPRPEAGFGTPRYYPFTIEDVENQYRNMLAGARRTADILRQVQDDYPELRP